MSPDIANMSSEQLTYFKGLSSLIETMDAPTTTYSGQPVLIDGQVAARIIFCSFRVSVPFASFSNYLGTPFRVMVFSVHGCVLYRCCTKTLAFH